MSRPVYVVGVGIVPFAKPGKSDAYPTMGANAARAALADARVPYERIEQAYAGYVFGDSCSGQRALYQVGLSSIPIINVNNNCATGSTALLKLVGELSIIVFVAFFVLVGGASLATRFLDQWGYHPKARQRAEHALRECSRQVRLSVGVLLVANIVIGCVVWAAFTIGGLPDAAGWGVAAAVLHIVPYVGMVVLTALGAAETFLVHGTLSAALGMAGALVISSTLIGTFVTAWLQGRAAKMNAAAVFIGLVFWGALWGVWGLFLGPALVVVLKVVAEHSRSGQRLALLLKG